jgi:hypothetical protein
LLRDDRISEQEARLGALLLEGLASRSIPFDAAFRERLAARTQALLEKYRDRIRE